MVGNVNSAGSAPVDLVVGSGGLLGGAVHRELRRRGLAVAEVKVPWQDEAQAEAAVVAAVQALAARSSRARIWWCAGAGVTSTTAQELAAEERVLAGFVAALAALAPTFAVTVFYASSAGGVYAGAEDPPFTELTIPKPLSEYGAAKLRAEAAVKSLAAAGARVAIARVANLYGPGQDLRKAQGVISQLCLASQLRRPLNIYVSLDTLRDYIYIDDAARRCVDFTEVVDQGAPGAVTKIIATGRSVSVGAVIGEANRIFRKKVPVVLASSPMRRQQARDLRLRSVVLTELDRVPLNTLAAGMNEVRRSIEARVRAGEHWA